MIGVKNLEMGKTVLDYLGPHVISRVLIRGKQEGRSQKPRCDNRNRSWSELGKGPEPRNMGGGDLKRLERQGNRLPAQSL